MRRLREGVLLSKDVQLVAARKNAQVVSRLRSQAEPSGRFCRAPAAIIKNSRISRVFGQFRAQMTTVVDDPPDVTT